MRVVACKSCGKSVVFLNNNKTGKAFPVDAETVKFGFDESLGFDSAYGHVSHFTTCPQRDQWRKPKVKDDVKGGGDESLILFK